MTRPPIVPKTICNNLHTLPLARHLSYHENNFCFPRHGLYGNLENSDIVSLKNSKLSNNLGVKRNAVGKKRAGISAEIGYNVLHFSLPMLNKILYRFLRYEYYDSMQDVEGNVIDNPRWQRSVITAGINWFVISDIAVKAQYSDRGLGSENFNQNNLEFTGKNSTNAPFLSVLLLISNLF